MRLFFFNKTKALKGYLIQKDSQRLDFYSKRAFTLNKNRKLLHIAFNLHTIEYAIKIGFLIFLISLAFGNSFFHLDYQKKELLIPISKTEVIQKIGYKHLAYNIYLYADGTIQLGPDIVREKELRLFILKEVLESEPRIKASLFIDKNTEMINVYNLLEELKESGIFFVHFMTKPDK